MKDKLQRKHLEPYLHKEDLSLAFRLFISSGEKIDGTLTSISCAAKKNGIVTSIVFEATHVKICDEHGHDVSTERNNRNFRIEKCPFLIEFRTPYHLKIRCGHETFEMIIPEWVDI